MILDAKQSFELENEARRSGLTATELEASQTSQQSLIQQQQALTDLQGENFSLKTQSGDTLKYVGDSLKAVDRPDGTRMRNILTDAEGNIRDADLQLIDGSVQILRDGKVIGYGLPDGTQAIYDPATGRIQKTISRSGEETLYSYTLNAAGAVTETLADSPSRRSKYDAAGRIKETLRKDDSQTIFYLNGIIDRIVNADGSQVTFTSQLSGADTVVTPQSTGPGSYPDSQGNIFYFSAGQVTKIVLTDKAVVEAITWDAAGKINDCTLTETDGTKHVYQAKALTRSTDTAGTTNYTYTATSVTASKNGSTWEYLSDGTPVRFTDLYGTVTTFFTGGTYKGRKDRETLSTGAFYVYDYFTAADGTISAKKSEGVGASAYSYATQIYGMANLAASTNPVLKASLRFDNDGSLGQAVNLIARGPSGNAKTLDIKFYPGTTSKYYWSDTNSTTNLSTLNLLKNTLYEVNIVWETSRIAVYVWQSGTPKPATPVFSVANRAWDPKFEL
jgi:YD repeat-containing protein